MNFFSSGKNPIIFKIAKIAMLVYLSHLFNIKLRPKSTE